MKKMKKTSLLLIKEVASGALSLCVILSVTYLYFADFKLPVYAPVLGAGSESPPITAYAAGSLRPARPAGGSLSGISGGLSHDLSSDLSGSLSGNLSNISHGLSGDLAIDLTGDNLSSGSAIYNSPCRIENPKEKTIILRMDDVQENAWNNSAMALIDTILSKNMSVTLAIIPMRFGKSAGRNEAGSRNESAAAKDSILQYIRDKANGGKFELAQHGTYHKKDEFLNLSEEEAYNATKKGLEQMERIFGVHPVTFIPPNNIYGENAPKALSKLGFRILSGEYGEYKSDGNIMYVGYTEQTKVSSSPELVPVSSVLRSCRNSLALRNLCVLNMHPQDYAESGGTALNTTRYLEFTALLDGLKKTDAKFITFKELIKC